MAIVEVTVVPIGTDSPSVSKFVAGCQKVLEGEKDIKYHLTPMSTIIEGDLGRIMSIIASMHETPFKAGALRVSTAIRIDDRRDKELTMKGKIESVMSKL